MPAARILPKLSIKAGWLEGVRQVPTPRFGPRPNPIDISLIVLHGISLPPGQYGGPYIDQIFLGTLDKEAHPYFAQVADLEVSTHVLIRRDGAITQYVSFLDRAWHAGRSNFHGRAECNDFGVGIELEGTDHEPYTDAQYLALREVIAALTCEYPAIGCNIAAHSAVAPLRKTDPGPAFEWGRIADFLPG
ncbi:MAG: 1,6-anhydro-N-acetylmuramyl-L-alanine amidase AmpD [Proteobacteria bacterium]|uniref:1,6-anhydro-N-acetylmuramyl-L-alanine amidase AmpD n=1 Tax=Candidatus Avisuccinivibrio stercorigallinarum TaxID=2840704 RepID=A0A9D9DB11_9GAMM|nr:1,6-anhydro-N-acetylmuramyl-L-alanine amidase AmpD [Candidatus Avisuccinivibrio stercorigallinarum]